MKIGGQDKEHDNRQSGDGQHGNGQDDGQHGNRQDKINVIEKKMYKCEGDGPECNRKSGDGQHDNGQDDDGNGQNKTNVMENKCMIVRGMDQPVLDNHEMDNTSMEKTMTVMDNTTMDQIEVVVMDQMEAPLTRWKTMYNTHAEIMKLFKIKIRVVWSLQHQQMACLK